MPVFKPEELIENRVEAIRAYHEECGIERAELDVSGGVDSAVMLGLLVRALGADKIAAVYSSVHSSSDSLRRTRKAATKFGVPLIELDLTDVTHDIENLVDEALSRAGYDLDELASLYNKDPTISGSLRSCIRAPVGRYVNRLTAGGLRHGTGNECEDRWLRFYQKGGDGEVDTNPLAMLSKGEVYQLALALGVPHEIIKALPTPDLWGVGDEHNDEAELTALSGVEWSYSRIDLETGQYTKVGTIERMSRFLDARVFANRPRLGASLLDGRLNGREISKVSDTVFAEYGLTRAHVASARKWERSTRHKFNPNIPTLGTRQELLDAGILTDELPEV